METGASCGRHFVQSAFSPRSSLRIRMASSTRDRNILPSPIFPVLAVCKIVSTTRFPSVSGSTLFSLPFCNKPPGYSRPRYTSVCPFCRPCPRTSVTVIPSIPISRSAFFTESNRDGWIIASSFIMEVCAPVTALRRYSVLKLLCFQVISLFAMLRNVQSLDLLLFRYPHARYHIYHLQQDDRPGESEAPSDQHADKLIAQLSPVPIQPADRFPSPINRIDCLLRKYPR